MNDGPNELTDRVDRDTLEEEARRRRQVHSMESRMNIVTFLKQDLIKNMNLLYFMEDYPVRTLQRINNHILLRGESDRHWVYISGSQRAGLDKIIANLTREDRCFAAIEDWVLPAIVRDRALAWRLSAIKLILPEEATFPQLPETLITPLSLEDVPHIYDSSFYKALTSPDYIRERIIRGPSAGVYESGRLVAWAMTHDDSSIGVMNVLEPYRRKRYAFDLTVYLIHQVRALGKIPYVHVEETNVTSLALARKVGFRDDRRLHWFEIRSE